MRLAECGGGSVAGSDEPRNRIGEDAVKQSLGEKLKKDIVAADTREKG
jgi:hypothetical protein